MGKQSFEDHKPGLAMVGLQFIYAVSALLAKAAFTEGVSPLVFIVYRQASATIALAPLTIIATRRRGGSQMALNLKGFSLVFVTALIGVTLNQFLYYQGLQLASASMASAVLNVVPGLTFLMAASVGLERVDTRSPRSMAKVFGTIICIGGAISIALFKGPKLLNKNSPIFTSIFHAVGEDWKMGCIFLFGSSSCYSLWLILQVPLCKNYFDPLSLSTWMCFLSSLQSALLTFFLEPDLKAWKLNSSFQLLCCLYVGIIGSGVAYYVQSWCISVRGPLYAAMFGPLCTVIVTILGVLLLHEQVYIGSLVGAAAVICGLYVVLWGKAKDFDVKREQNLVDDHMKVSISTDRPLEICEANMQEPLLDSKLNVPENRD